MQRKVEKCVGKCGTGKTSAYSNVFWLSGVILWTVQTSICTKECVLGFRFGLVWFGLFMFNRSTAGTDKCREK